MPENMKPLQSIVILANPTMQESCDEARKFQQAWQGLSSIETTLSTIDNIAVQERIATGEFDLLVVFGGDGTMLRAGHMAAPVNLPLLGINLGRFGFLMQLRKDEWKDAIPRLLTRDYKLEHRMMLYAELLRGDAVLDSWQVVNEVVVCRGRTVLPIRISASVDGNNLASYVADGLIAATPTGSTGYALAVNGPILPPELRNILIIPVAPHMSLDHAVILPEGATVVFTPETDHEAVVSIDGHEPVDLQAGDRVRISAGEHTLKFVVFQDPGYFYRSLSLYWEPNPIRNGIK
jgi:NAD+ kinase